MSRGPARFTQADVSRAIRAAQQNGVAFVEIMPDGTIRILTAGDVYKPADAMEKVEAPEPVVL